jgi:hypothetical protein
MFKPTGNAKLELHRNSADDRDLRCFLEFRIGKLQIVQSQPPTLVIDTSRPTLVGWRWDPTQETSPIEGPSFCEQANLPRFGREFVGFRPFIEPDLTTGRLIASEIETFFPPGKRSYSTEVEIDAESRTVWFPLPLGQSIHRLTDFVDVEGPALISFVLDWFWDGSQKAGCPFVVDYIFVDRSGEKIEILCYSKTTDTEDRVEIPASLLDDPIRNGSECLEHGFNPWNEEQKARISAHLEQELSRLTELFQRDAPEPSCGALPSTV